MLWEIRPQKCFALSWSSSNERGNSRAPTTTALCNHIRNSPTAPGKETPPKLNHHYDKETTRKLRGNNQEKSNSKILLTVKGREAHPLLPQTSFTHTKNNICFCPINCFYMGGTHHTWLYSYTQVSFRGSRCSMPIMMPPVSSSGWHWQICRNCTVRFPERILSQRDEKMCWVTEQYRQRTHHWALDRFAPLMWQEDKAPVKHWHHHTACHFLGVDHTHLSLLWAVLQCFCTLQLYLSGTQLLQVLQQPSFFTWAVGRVTSQVRPRMNQIQQSSWTKFLSPDWGKSRAIFKEESLVLN